MTRTEITEQELSDMGIRVFPCPGLQRKAIATADGYVGLGETADSRETRTVLEHEKQHYRLQAFYPPTADAATRRRAEARVHRALIRELCPAETLQALHVDVCRYHLLATVCCHCYGVSVGVYDCAAAVIVTLCVVAHAVDADDITLVL